MQHDAADGGPLIPSNAPDAIVLLVASSPAVKVRSRTARKCTEPHAYHSAARGSGAVVSAPWDPGHDWPGHSERCASILNGRRLPQGLSALTVFLYLLGKLVPGTESVLAIKATNTYGAHSYVWNVFTASFFNTSFVMVFTLRCRGTPAPCCSNMRKG
jgi:hypothetical protein